MFRYFNIILILILVITNSLFAQKDIINQAEKYISKNFDELLFVSIHNQKLYHIKNKKIIDIFVISSSKYGIGNIKDSNKTPLGLHKVKEKHGKDTPMNGKMIGRIFHGEIATVYKDTTKSITDDITSRILWLEGIEIGKNKGENIDSYRRHIYIHGTSEEGRLGTPASHGCIRMKNKDVIDLYKMVEVGTLVLIL